MPDTKYANAPSSKESRSGTAAAFVAYGIWGLFPLYWKLLVSVDPVQILAHRIVWAALLSIALLAYRKNGLAEFLSLFRSPKRALAVLVSAVLITANWGVYIWAVNSGKVADSSLGYYINPLFSVALGALFFRESLDRGTVAAISIASAGVIGAALFLGNPPWISLFLAATFALYGFLKKRVGLDPLMGLAAETLAATPLAAGWLLFQHQAGRGAFLNPELGGGALVSILLVVSGVVTAVPLLAFAKAANSISLQSMGFIQYLSPSSQLAIGILVFGERPDASRLLAIATVVAAVLIYVFTRPREGAR